MSLYLAIDSGGSKTLWVLINENGKRKAEIKTPGLASIKEGMLPVLDIVQEAYNALKNYEKPKSIYFSLGGPNIEEVKNALRQTFIDVPVLIERESNGNAILCAAKFLGASAVVMCGTGSVAVGKTKERRLFCGGWGPTYGDGGSGGGLGCDALKAFLRTLDGMGDVGAVKGLFSHLTEGLDVESFDGRMEVKSRALAMQRNELAALAVPIYELAQKGDAFSKRLYDNAANEIVLMAEKVCDGENPVLLCGGFLRNKPQLINVCRNKFSKAEIIYNEKFNPIVGACVSALQNSGIEVTKEMFETILNES